MARKLASLLLVLGMISIAAGILTGEGQVGIFIIFPYVAGTGWLILVGVLLVFTGVFLYLMSVPLLVPLSDKVGKRYRKKTMTSRAGGMVLIGPIPIVVSSDARLAVLLLVVGISLAISIYLFIPLLF